VSDQEVGTAVIGGSQAGLAVGYHLRRRGLPFVILDENERIGDAWRKRWDSLRLFTPGRYNGLPGMPFPGSPLLYPTKDELADYLETYARTFELPVRTAVKAEKLSKVGSRFEVSCGERRLYAENVVLATGAFAHPRVPPFARELAEHIVQLHSTEYRNRSQVRDGGVLVVGAGNSGAEIAIELSRAGHRTWLSGRAVGEETPFEVGSLPDKLLTPVLWFVANRLLTTKSSAGRKLRDKSLGMGWPLVRIRNNAISAAGIERLSKMLGVKDGAPLLEDGRVLEVANIVWATGYEPDFRWIELPLLESSGRLAHDRGVVASSPGLYFIGNVYLHSPTSALLGGVGRDAEYIVNHLASRRSMS
jgi:putative flavoprotein involved in K+ transport